MKCLLIASNEPLPETKDFLAGFGGEWEVEVENLYVDRMSLMSEVLDGILQRIDERRDIASYDRVVFVPPGLSAAVLPFFDGLLQYVREDVVPEQLNMIRGAGGTYIPCPEFPVYRSSAA